MKDVAFGQYYPTESCIHRLDPRAKLVFSLLFIIFIFFVVSYTMYAAVLLFLLTVTLLARIPIRSVLKSVKAVIFLVIFTAILNLFLYSGETVLAEWWVFSITIEGIHFAIKMALRLTFLVTGTAILTLTTTPMELTDGIESLLKPLKYIKVPVHDIAIIMSTALRFIPTLASETDKIMMAQKARGASIDTGKLHERVKALISILIPLFVSAFRRADELADALDSRCYKASPKRTKYKVLKFSWKDLVALLVIVALIVLIMLDKYLWGNIDNIIYGFFAGLVGGK